jgi:hypothetical protein
MELLRIIWATHERTAMDKLPSEGLWSYSVDLTSTHIEAAVGAAAEARQLHMSKESVSGKNKERHKTITAILHSYSALEAALSLLGHEFFIDAESGRYISQTDRDIGLDMLARGWFRTVTVPDKLRFAVARGGRPIAAKLESQLRELGNLRNWLAHGFVYKTTLLLRMAENQTSFEVLDQEVSVNWSAKFPNTRFSPLDQLNYSDCITALTIVFESLREISAATGKVFHAVDYYSGAIAVFVIIESTDIVALIERHVGGASSSP